MKNMQVNLVKWKNQMKLFRAQRDAQGVSQYNAARWEYLCLLEKQEIFWKQRAKQFWLAEGDQNTRFFHNYASNRRRKNCIKGLKDMNGVWKEESGDIQEIVVEYFSSLFQSSVSNGSLTDGENVVTVSDDQNHMLLVPVREEVVKAAVFAMYPDKSPGPDGLNPAFFRLTGLLWGLMWFVFVRTFCVEEIYLKE